jgi:hypothetical protein
MNNAIQCDRYLNALKHNRKIRDLIQEEFRSNI